MRAWISLLAIACIGASLLAGSPLLSIGFVVAAILLAGFAVCTYVVAELRTGRPASTRGPVDMRAFTRRIPVEHPQHLSRNGDASDRHPHTV